MSEEIIGRWLPDRPADVSDRVVIATKGRFPMGDGVNDLGTSRRHLQRALDASLRRLGVDAVDLYQVHAWDPVTPLEETLGTLDALRARRQGRATSGCRTTPAGRSRRPTAWPAAAAGARR